MKKRNTLVIGSLIAAAVIIALTYGLTFSYLTDRDARDNIITIGEVDLTIVEDGYTDSRSVVAQSIVNKAPKIENTGKNNEYVFMTIRVPKRNVTLLHEDEAGAASEGKPIASGNYEIFKTLADGAANIGTVPGTYVDLKYHQGSDPDPDNNAAYIEGWVLLTGETKTGNSGYDEYTFGYNKLLAHGDTTAKALFDNVQLKSFMDQEVTGADTATEIAITAAGIQSRNLGVSGLENDKEKLSADNLTDIYNIVKNKKAQS